MQMRRGGAWKPELSVRLMGGVKGSARGRSLLICIFKSARAVGPGAGPGLDVNAVYVNEALNLHIYDNLVPAPLSE